VRQTVTYRYAAPIRDLHQRLMLVAPPRHGDQLTRQWGLDVSLEVRGREWQDRFGNRVVDLAVDVVDTVIAFEVWSLIERRSPSGPAGGFGAHQIAADPVWTRPTALTQADPTLADAAGELVAAGPGGVALGERICDWVHEHMAYRHDVTSIHTTASAALALGSGVCQDYAHVALALCRKAGLAARYVSGHLLGEGGSHAWIEVLVPDRGQPSQWHVAALDPTHNRRVGLTYLTIATGRDYMDVAPTSGRYRTPVAGVLTMRKQATLVAVDYRGDQARN
jgi:transglutaminase-like putative cysteine protease